MNKIIYEVPVDPDYDQELAILVDQFREEGIKTTKEELLQPEQIDK
jgi:hypothetical protein